LRRASSVPADPELVRQEAVLAIWVGGGAAGGYGFGAVMQFEIETASTALVTMEA
jgi:hypothetical protein